MPAWLLGLPIQSPVVLVPVYAVSGLLVLALVVPVPGARVESRRWWPTVLLAGALGALAGLAAVWALVDTQDPFGAPTSLVIRLCAAGGGAAIGLAIRNLVGTGVRRKVLAVGSIVSVVCAGALLVNRDVAYYLDLGDAVGQTGVRDLRLPSAASTAVGLRDWRAPRGMPATGIVGTVRIPGVSSHWRGRPAWVYLPPAARTANPPRLPVVIAFSGQPGGPADVFVAGGVAKTMDALASTHRGLAPIVVVPDQLGSYGDDPMCVDSRMGDVATYLVRDVRTWTLDHLPASTDRRFWTTAGFSEGATCAVQLATGYPSLFGSSLAIAPEIGPIDRTLPRTLREAFHGSRSEWEAAQPTALMRAHRPYLRTRALYCVGAQDARYTRPTVTLARASRAAGMAVTFTRLPAVAHNWNTAAAGFRWGAPLLAAWWGLP